MRIAHLSDTHLGHMRYGKVVPETGINQREQDVYDAFERVVDGILADEPDIVVHTGDLFDSPRPANRAVYRRASRSGASSSGYSARAISENIDAAAARREASSPCSASSSAGSRRLRPV